MASLASDCIGEADATAALVYYWYSDDFYFSGSKHPTLLCPHACMQTYSETYM